MWTKSRLITLILVGILCPFAMAQEPAADPAAPSTIVQQTLAKIRDVEKLDKYIGENTLLKTENTTLKTQIASLGLQVAKLTEELKLENERLRKQLLELPNFSLKSKVLAGANAMAVLQLGERSFRIRNDVEMTIPLSNGVWILMKVEKITKDVIELKFPELDRTVVIYD
jgi:regulator of replication initiation timing